jgi:hypothetical protein
MQIFAPKRRNLILFYFCANFFVPFLGEVAFNYRLLDTYQIQENTKKIQRAIYTIFEDMCLIFFVFCFIKNTTKQQCHTSREKKKKDG